MKDNVPSKLLPNQVQSLHLSCKMFFVRTFLSLLTLASGSVARPPTRQDLASERRQTACENTPTSRRCWGNYSVDTDYYDTIPDTGVVREYWLNVEDSTISPDGFLTNSITFNGTVPGPTITADWGDTLVIHVTNSHPYNGTAIHWHGMRQLNTNYADGVPGVTQCPIAPGETYTYRFHACQYGTSWYHSHLSLQLGVGLLGAIVINGPATADYDVDVGPVVLQDWYHGNVWEIWAQTQRVVALVQPVAENGLINGMNPYKCAGVNAACVGGATARFNTTFESGKKYRFRLIGAQTDGYFKFGIDGHKLTVIAADLVPIKPYVTESVLVASGQRYDVVVEADQAVGNYWLRAVYQTACNQNDNENKDNILGIVRYSGLTGTATTADPTTKATGSITIDSCGDEPYASLVPHVEKTVGSSDVSDNVNLSFYYDLPELVFHWTLGGKTLLVDWAAPTILEVFRAGGTSPAFPAESNVVSVDAVGEWVYWIIQDLTLVGAYHPMHLHGHDFYILAQGKGVYIPGLVSLNRNNPPRRDTATLYGNGYTVIAFIIDNPGSWLLHCVSSFDSGFRCTWADDVSLPGYENCVEHSC